MKLPKHKSPINFFCIGSHKGGTTWLYSMLNSLPDFDMPPIKEIHYFDRYERYPSPGHLLRSKLSDRIFDISYNHMAIRKIIKQLILFNLRDFNWYIKYYYSEFDDNWYLNLFKLRIGITGDITPAYSMLESNEIQQMYDLSPKSKIIFLLRNPIERSWSHFRDNTRRAYYSKSYVDMEDSEIINYLSKRGNVLRSDYYNSIKRFSEVFPPTKSW